MNFKDYADDAKKRLVPMIGESAFVMQLVPDGDKPDSFDIKFALEVGVAILMGKPILAVVGPGRKIPGKLNLVADMIVYADPGTDEGKKAIQQAAKEMKERIDAKSDGTYH